jgi:hypothetical protein
VFLSVIKSDYLVRDSRSLVPKLVLGITQMLVPRRTSCGNFHAYLWHAYTNPRLGASARLDSWTAPGLLASLRRDNTQRRHTSASTSSVAQQVEKSKPVRRCCRRTTKYIRTKDASQRNPARSWLDVLDYGYFQANKTAANTGFPRAQWPSYRDCFLN